MFKKILNKKEQKLFDYTIRPFIIYCILTGLIIIIGSKYGNITTDKADGYICSMLLVFIVNYLNLSFIDLQNINKNKK